MATFYIENFGCRAARADGEAISAQLHSEGLAQSTLADAEVVIVNTCSVTAEADRDARAFIRKSVRVNPESKIIVTGCYAQRAPAEIAALPGVAAVVGNSHKGLTAQIARNAAGLGAIYTLPSLPPALLPAAGLLQSSHGSAPIWVDDHFAHSEIENVALVPGDSPGTQTRPNLKIQEGCGNRCTFCIIPTTRGHSRSLALEKILDRVDEFAAAGGKELVLSGINLGRWGRDFPGPLSFAELVATLLERTRLPRLRLSSIEPMDWTPALIGLMAEYGGSRLARHAHLPLQSGSDAVLRRMHRRYRPWHYIEKAESLFAASRDTLALGADVMVGFPGETDSEFRETHDLIGSLPFAYLHLFPFSPRPGTRGDELHRQHPVPSQAVRERMAILKALADQKSHAFRSRFLGQTLPAITLHASASLAARSVTPALSDNFLPVEIPGMHPANQLVEVTITGFSPSGSLEASSLFPSAPALSSIQVPPAQTSVPALH